MAASTSESATLLTTWDQACGGTGAGSPLLCFDEAQREGDTADVFSPLASDKSPHALGELTEGETSQLFDFRFLRRTLKT